MRHGKIDVQQLPIADDRRIVGDFHRLGMAGIAPRGHVVAGSFRGAARIARNGAFHASHPLEHPLHAPETTARQGDDGRFAGLNKIPPGRRYHHRRFLRAGQAQGGGKQNNRTQPQ